MIKLTQIGNVQELIKLWPRLLLLAKTDLDPATPDTLLQLYLGCFANGAIFIVRGDKGFCGVCCVKHQSEYVLELKSIPNDKGTGIAKECINFIKTWAKLNGYTTITVSTNRLNGSAFRYFEKTLGFRRRTITFELPLTQ